MRARHVLVASVLVALVLGRGALAAVRVQPSSVSTLRPDGIGTVRFGSREDRTVAALSAVFGTPIARGVNLGCGPRYTEVEWGSLAVEFRSGRFSGYRYLVGGFPFDTHGLRQPAPLQRVTPRLATSAGIGLGSTLAQVGRAYKELRLVGTDRSESANGLVFVDNAKHDPVPPSSRIVEIKIGTCGDF